MILKLLLILVVIALVYFLFFKKKPLKNSNPKNKQKDEKLQSNDMIECSSCGTYASLEDSIISNNKYYCSDECVDKA